MTAIVGMALGKDGNRKRNANSESHPHTTANFLLPDSQHTVSRINHLFETQDIS